MLCHKYGMTKKPHLKWHTLGDRLSQLAVESHCMSDILKALNLTCTMGNYTTLEKWLIRHKIPTAHFGKYHEDRSNRHQRSAHNNRKVVRWTVETACQLNSYADRSIVKRLLIETSAIPYMCKCGNRGEWEGAPLTLQLEHKNGNRQDHRVENLCFLCPNCHSQTTTYAGRGKKQLILPGVPSNAEVADVVLANG